MAAMSGVALGASRRLRAWSTTPVPSLVLMAAKLLVLYAWIAGGIPCLPDAYLPFLTVLDRLPEGIWTRSFWGTLFVAASLALWLDRAVRPASFACGACILLSVLASRPLYSNSTLSVGLLLVLVSLQSREQGAWMFRTQLGLIYLGAGLNKLLEPDWRSGRFFGFWTREVLERDGITSLAEQFPGDALFVALGAYTILAELTLGLLFVVPRWNRVGVWVGLALHGSMLVFTGGELSWVFLYAMSCAYLCILREPPEPPHSGLARLLATPARLAAIACLFFVVAAWFQPLRGPWRQLF